MRINRRNGKDKLMAEINITPFTDVVLVLLIIFMVTTPLIVQSTIKVRLPKAASADTESDKNIVITIDSNGAVLLDKKNMDLKELKSEISMRLLNKPDSPVIIKGDKEVKYDSVIQVIDAAKQAGAKKFALSVELKKPD